MLFTSFSTITEKGDKKKWGKEIIALVEEVVGDIRIPGKRRVQGKWSVFTNSDLIELILSFAHPRSFNYTKEDLPYTLILNVTWRDRVSFMDEMIAYSRKKFGHSEFVEHIDFKGGNEIFWEVFQWGQGNVVTIPAIEMVRFSLRALVNDEWDSPLYPFAIVYFTISHCIINFFEIRYFKNIRNAQGFSQQVFVYGTFYVLFERTDSYEWRVTGFAAYGGYDHDLYYEGAVIQSEEGPPVRIIEDKVFATL